MTPKQKTEIDVRLLEELRCGTREQSSIEAELLKEIVSRYLMRARRRSGTLGEYFDKV